MRFELGIGRKAAAAVAVILTLGLAAGATAAAPVTKVGVMLDWTPNPDHVGLLYAQQRGYFTRARLAVSLLSPSDPTTPLKLVGVGKVDLAVSYEPEVFFGAEKGLPVRAVAALVPVPLNSLIATKPQIRSVADLKGRTVAITGIPTDRATLSTILAHAGLRDSDVHAVSVGYNLLPALLSGKADAILGGYRNVEAVELEARGLHPLVLPVDRLGVPAYDELVLVANSRRLDSDASYRDAVRRFVSALVAATAAAVRDPAGALAATRKSVSGDAAFVARSVSATLPLLTPPGSAAGCISTAAWQRFGAWLRSRGLLEHSVGAASVMTTTYLPSTCRGG